ncbi:MAG: hypothetical protein ABI273_05045 [Lacunisphaera sp.]
MRGWLIPVAVLALTPKCALCLLAYAGLGTLLGLGGQDLCGGAKSASGYWELAFGLISTGAGTVFLGRFLRSRRPS